MVAELLRAEIHSTRFDARPFVASAGLSLEQIERPDLADADKIFAGL
jgi:hypothetical protein